MEGGDGEKGMAEGREGKGREGGRRGEKWGRERRGGKEGREGKEVDGPLFKLLHTLRVLDTLQYSQQIVHKVTQLSN